MAVDLLTPAQKAIIAALKPLESDVTLGTTLRVLQHVPIETDPPMIVLGAMSATDQGLKGQQLELITATIHGVVRGEKGRSPLLALLHAARHALDGQEITPAGGTVQFEFPNFINGEVDEVLEDGVTYTGRITIQFLAAPA